MRKNIFALFVNILTIVMFAMPANSQITSLEKWNQVLVEIMGAINDGLQGDGSATVFCEDVIIGHGTIHLYLTQDIVNEFLGSKEEKENIVRFLTEKSVQIGVEFGAHTGQLFFRTFLFIRQPDGSYQTNLMGTMDGNDTEAEITWID